MTRWARVGVLFGAMVATGYAAPTPTPAPITPVSVSQPWPLPPLVEFIHKMPPPPRVNSFRDRMDLQDAEARQKGITKEDIASIQQTYLFNVFYFSTVLGPNFNAKNFPKTAAFFAQLTGEANVVVGNLKNTYERLRPFAGHPEKIRLLVKNEPGYSYPSGHTTRSRLCAFVMAELAPPAYHDAIFHASEKVAVDRILAGEHYLTDLEAGRHLGKILFSFLCQDEQFQRDILALKAAEWSPPPVPLKPAPASTTKE